MDWAGIASGIQDAIKDTFGEPVAYRIGGVSPGVLLSGAFNEMGVSIDMNTGSEVLIPQPNVGIKLADLQPDPLQPAFVPDENTDRLVIRGVLYGIANYFPDGEGMVKIMLHRRSS